MNAEIISVGTELLLGGTVNTDTTLIARELSRLGINLLFTGTVGDNPERLEFTISQALSRSDLVITTGGLGPTGDDLTKEIIAKAAGKKLVFHEESFRRIEEFMGGSEMPASERKQAYLPEGCTALKNNVGTAPGCAFRTDAGKIVMMFPGPPSELVPMLHDYGVPYLLGLENAVIVSENIHVFGIGESKVAEMISDLTEGANPTAATYAKRCEMFVRVTAKASTQKQAEQMCRPLVEKIKERLGDAVYSTQQESLEELVVAQLAARGLKLATAESCTGGLLAKRITDIPGSSDVFEMGAVTYANRIKTKVLGVPEEMLAAYGAVSEPVARAMAEGIRREVGSDLGIGITGIAGPGGGTPEKPVGLIYIALCDGEKTYVRCLPGGTRPRGRDYQRIYASSSALDMVRRWLSGLPVVP